jgi:hypothetical protein
MVCLLPPGIGDIDRRCFTLISAGVSFVSAIFGDGRDRFEAGGQPLQKRAQPQIG